LPTQNRVYGRAALQLGLAELASIDRLLLGERLGRPELVTIGGHSYYVARAGPLDADALAAIALLSSVYAAFELRDGLLAPIELPAVEAYAHFLRTWLQNHRLKHRLAFHPLRREGRTIAHLLEAELSPSREELERGRPQRVRMVAADGVEAGEHFRPASADLL